MNDQRCMLAAKNSFGSIYQCAEGCFHLQLGPVNIRLTEEAYFDLVDMVHTSAANYEVSRSESGGS